MRQHPKMLRYLRWGSAAVLGVESSTSLTPLNSDFETAHVLALEALLGIFSVTLTLEFDEGKRALNKQEKERLTSVDGEK